MKLCLNVGMDDLFPTAPELLVNAGMELRTNWAMKANLLLFKLFYLAVSKPICFKNVKVLSKESGNGIISIIGNNKMTKSLRANTLLRLCGHKMESFGLVRQSELQLLQKKLNKTSAKCKAQRSHESIIYESHCLQRDVAKSVLSPSLG